MISRIWPGWTTPQNANLYEELLKREIFAGINSRGIPGYRGIQLLRGDGPDDVEFYTLMRFDSCDVVRRFAGEEFEAAVVRPKARALLKRFDERSSYDEIGEESQT